MLLKPIKKNNKYVSYVDNIVKYFISDIKIKSIQKYVDNKGYLIKIYIPNTVNEEIIHSICCLDNTFKQEILLNSHEWFHKELSKDEIEQMYSSTYCAQSQTIDVILSNSYNTNIVLNDKKMETIDNIYELIKDIKQLKKCLINIEIQHIGLYYYKETAHNKWVIRSLDITDTSYNICTYSKDDVEDKMEDNIRKISLLTSSKIQSYQEKLDKFSANIKEIRCIFENLKISYGEKWEELLDKINHMIQNHEEQIKNI